MTESFVGRVGEKILQTHGAEGLKNVLVVIPSQRIGLHLKKEMAQSFQNVAWLPQIQTIDEFITGLTSDVVMDETLLTFELYKSYRRTFKEPESFDSFLNWSSQILADFNEIDKYLLESKNVFKNLKAIKEIESWSFNETELTSTQQKFLEFWETLGLLYQNFYNDLSAQGYCTKSSVYKQIALDPIRFLSPLGYEKIYFIGFNALSKSEEEMFKFLYNSGQAEILWDADAYYVNDTKQEAGKFLRRYRKWAADSFLNLPNNLNTQPKELTIYEAASNIAQTQAVADIMSSSEEFNTTKSALVFSDEALLRPMLNVLPDTVDQVNVAMGYPLQASNTYSLLDQIFSSLKNIARYKQKNHLYFKDYKMLFHHELIQQYLHDLGVDLSNIDTKINKYNYAYIPKQFMEEALGEHFAVFSFIFYDKSIRVPTVLEKIILLFQKIRLKLLQGSGNLVEKEAMTHLLLVLRKMTFVLNENPILESVDSLVLLTRQLLKKGKLSFYGEPLEGLQMLGLLESRGLDFENVIILSCNEDVLPQARFSQSLIPHDLRSYLGLPSKEDKEAIYAYYFYRLLQRSKKVHLVYNGGAPDLLSTNEVSRYLLQIAQEIDPSVVKITKVPSSGGVDFSVLNATSFERMFDNLDYHERLKSFLQQGISASALNTFRKCPRDFFFQYILRLSEEDKIEETIEHSTYGTIVHAVLENLYKVAGKVVSVNEIEVMQNTYQKLVQNEFEERFPNESYKKGKNLLQFENATYSISKFLQNEKSFIQKHGAITILGLEKKFEKELSFMSSLGSLSILLKGTIDRIDRVGDTIRIVDYKTGIVGEKLEMIEDFSKLGSYSLQLLLYAYLFDTAQKEDKVSYGIVSFKEIGKGLQTLKNASRSQEDLIGISQEQVSKVESLIHELVEAFIASSFEHNPKSKYCKFC